MLLVVLGVVGVDEYIVKVDDDTNIQHVGKKAIDKALKSGWSIGEALGYNAPLVGSIASTKGSLGLVALGNPKKVVGVPKVEFGIDASPARRVE